MAEAGAPGKAILPGEHAVVYGEPAIAVAQDLRTRCAWRAAQFPDPADPQAWLGLEGALPLPGAVAAVRRRACR